MEHWECTVCHALTPAVQSECWQCKCAKGTSLPPAEATKVISAARRRVREEDPDVWNFGLAQIGLTIGLTLLLSLAIMPAYCLAFYGGDCPYRVPERKLVLFAVALFAVVVVELAMIYVVAPRFVSQAFAESYFGKRGGILRKLYTRLVRHSYRRDDA
jgi:hypothetical protein